MIVDGNKVWVTGVSGGLAVFDSSTGMLLATVRIEGETCGAPDVGFGAIWVPTCGGQGIHRVDLVAGSLVASIDVEVPKAGEFTIGVGEGGVWTLADDENGSACRLVRIDPRTNSVADVFQVPDGASAVRAGLGGVWVSYHDLNHVLRVDPRSGRVSATIETGPGPRFMDIGEGGVWVMNQTAGSVSRIDPRIDSVVATIDVDSAEIDGGDLKVGGGFIWLRGSEALVSQIDPASNRVIARFGETAGSGSAHANEGQLWISAHDVTSLYRLPLG